MTKKYRPSSGTEGMIFMDRFCERCAHDTEESPCMIIASTMVYDVDHEKYPEEWTYDENDSPTCTKFKEAKQ